MDVQSIALLVIGSGIAASIIYVVLRRTAAKIAALQTVAQSLGWDFHHTVHNRGPTTSFTCKPADWVMTLKSRKSRYASSQVLVWHSPVPALDKGMAVMVAPFSNKLVPLTDGKMPLIAARMVKTTVLKAMQDIYKVSPEIEVASHQAIGPSGIVLATPGQDMQLNPLHGDTALSQARQSLPDLTIVLDTTGLGLCLRTDLKDLDQLNALAMLGVKLRDRLRS